MKKREKERERGSYEQRAFMIAEKLREIISPDLFIRGAPFPPLSRPLSLIVTVRNRCCFIGGCKVISRLECLVFNHVDDDVHRCMTLRARVCVYIRVYIRMYVCM